VEKNHSGLSGCSGVSIRSVSGDLFMTGSDESDSTATERVEHLNDGVTAQSENDFDAKLFEITDQLFGYDLTALPGGCLRLRLKFCRLRFRHSVPLLYHSSGLFEV
jgi:hypothetical protein